MRRITYEYSIGDITATWIVVNLASPNCIYCNLSKVRPWAMNLSGSSKRGVGVFARVVIFLLKICPPHMQFV